MISCLFKCSVAILFATFTSLTHAEKIHSANSLPTTLQQAIAIRGYTFENHLISQLDGKTSGSVKIKIELETKNRFVLYEEKTNFEVGESMADQWVIESVVKPATVSFLDPVSKKFKMGFSGQNIFEITLKLKQALAKSPALDQSFQIYTKFQACNKEVCLLPATAELIIPLRKNTSQGDTEEPSFIEKLPEKLSQALSSSGLGLGVFQILFLAGLLTAFTPCVYPLYPITIGIFVNWSQTGIRPWLAGLLYSSGSILSYSLLGIVAAASGKLFGSLTQTPLFQIGIGLVLILSAVFYSGLWEFPVPEKLRAFFAQSKNDPNAHPSRRYIEAFFMGIGLGFVASPCVGPVLVALLAWMSDYLNQSSYASWIEGLTLFAVFGSGMMTPFFLLSILVGRGFRTPRIGALAHKAKWIGSLLMVAGSLYFLVPGIQSLFPAKAAKKFQFPIITAMESVPDNGRFTILDFRADWCIACLELEGETFQDAKVASEIREAWNFQKIDMTVPQADSDKIAEAQGVLGLPTLVFLNPQGKACDTSRLTGFENAEKFLKRLESIKQQCL